MAGEIVDKKFDFLAAFHESFADGPNIPSALAHCGCLGDKISNHLRDKIAKLKSFGPEIDLPVIFQVTADFFSNAERTRCRVGSEAQTKVLRLVKGYGVSLTPSQIHLLVRSPYVQYVTFDAPIRTTSNRHRDRAQSCADLPAPQHHPRAGKPVGVAILDTGVSEEDLPAYLKVRLALNFVSGKQQTLKDSSDRATAHGTEIIKLIAEKGAHVDSSRIDALALRVVDENKVGATSDLIRAIDWVIENREQFSIRLANLSLAHQPMESHLQDPLCQAVRKMVESGIVTTTSTGIPKVDDAWNIGSPGIEPSVITVADENYGSMKRSPIETAEDEEDWTVGFKPDIRVRTGADGPSLAAAEVSGTVAGMLSANPSMSPTLVKSILLSTARRSGKSSWLNARAAVHMSAQISKHSDWVLDTEGPALN